MREIIGTTVVFVLVTAGLFVTRYGLFKALRELWRGPGGRRY